MRSRVLESSIVNKKTALGQVQFSKSSFTDPHIVKIIDAIVAAGDAGIDKAFIVNTITQKQQQMSKFAAMSPALYKTMSENMVETELFNILWKLHHNFPKRHLSFSSGLLWLKMMNYGHCRDLLTSVA
jgi:hypothetical protein